MLRFCVMSVYFQEPMYLLVVSKIVWVRSLFCRLIRYTGKSIFSIQRTPFICLEANAFVLQYRQRWIRQIIPLPSAKFFSFILQRQPVCLGMSFMSKCASQQSSETRSHSTDRLQALDLSVNKSCKDYYSNEVCELVFTHFKLTMAMM